MYNSNNNNNNSRCLTVLSSLQEMDLALGDCRNTPKTCAPL